MEIVRSGVMPANFATITVLSVTWLAQRSWPTISSRINERARNTDSFIVTMTAFFALSTLPAPISFDTLVLKMVQKRDINHHN